MRLDVEYSPLGDAPAPASALSDFWLYVWMRRVAVVTAHVVALGFTVLVTLLSRPGTSLFSWHPVCMSVAFCLCMTEGILVFSTEASPFCFKSRKAKVRLHWFLQAVMLLGGATGLGFMVASKNVSEHSHLATWHSVLGVATLGAVALQAACGLALLLPVRLRRGPTLSRLRLYHATCGLVAYLLATATVMLAVCSDWFQASVRGLLWYAFLLLPLFPALVVMKQITGAFLPKKKITS
ncbi:Cytochrome b561 domain-containing protein 1-like [Scleropages formosus]|uniref:ascorbate ferrireductase (transmembrane) n=1 Tax=Scleropages formosus TaxID=113540 RepID=A0A0P7X3S8_SCLFO|nr:Cytochrome b561 domain-containing protein 1-like [Scleropages formosus]